MRDAPRRRQWVAATGVVPVEAGACLLAYLTGQWFSEAMAYHLTVGPFLAGVAAVLLVTVPLRRRVLVPARAWVRAETSEPSLRSLVGELRTGPGSGWWRRTAALGVGWLLLWTALAGILGGALTFRQYLRYAAGTPDPPHPMWSVLLLVVTALVAAVLVAAASDRAFEAGLRDAVSTARARPTAVGRRALAVGVRGTVLGGGVGFVWALDGEPFAPARLLLMLVVASTLSLLTRGVEFTRLGDAPERVPSPGLPRPAMAVALVGLLVVAPVAGTVVVRTDDTGYADAEIEALPDDPSEALAAAQTNTFQQSYRRVTIEQLDRPGDDYGKRTTVGVDRSDRQYNHQVATPRGNQSLTSFWGEGVHASRGEGSPQVPTSEASSPLRWRGGNWSAFATGSGAFYVAAVGAVRETPSPDAPWHVVSENATALVLGVTGTAVAEATEYISASDSTEIAANSSIRVTIDPERGVLQSVRVNATYYPEGNRSRAHHWEVIRHYENVGNHDVERPDPIGPRRPAEWVWDLLYY